MEELIRRWKLEIAELSIIKLFYVNLQDFERASEYREKEKELQKRLDEIKSFITELPPNP